MLSFIDKYQLLSSSQFGFRSNHNTELAILHALDFIMKSLDGKIPVIALYIDVSKAFDSLDHSILLDKLFLYGFRGTSHLWLTSYLANRFQYVEISGVKSNMHKLYKGVPQGSILGPLLFLIYIYK
jgi:retron-type reverse transcriptase